MRGWWDKKIRLYEIRIGAERIGLVRGDVLALLAAIRKEVESRPSPRTGKRK